MTKDKAIELLYRISDSQYDGPWGDERREALAMAIESLQRKIVLCKNCRFFESDVFKEVYGVPIIVAHEVCNKWGDCRKTKENGFCFLGKEKGAIDDEEMPSYSIYKEW